MGSATNTLAPPSNGQQLVSGAWHQIAPGDAVATLLAARYLPTVDGVPVWRFARFAKAVYLYHEMTSDWLAVVKFYSIKTGSRAAHWALHEYECIQRARAALARSISYTAPEPLGLEHDALILAYASGATLSDLLKTRHTQPSLLGAALRAAGGFLATLHLAGVQPDMRAEEASFAPHARACVHELIQAGVVRTGSEAAGQIQAEIEHWLDDPMLFTFGPTLLHGDANCANFLLVPGGGVVGIDWEYSTIADPAADLGRLAASVAVSLRRDDGDSQDIALYHGHLLDGYCQMLPSHVDTDGLFERVRFYQGWSTLRGARNQWLPELFRATLVAEGLSLLQDLPSTDALGSAAGQRPI